MMKKLTALRRAGRVLTACSSSASRRAARRRTRSSRRSGRKSITLSEVDDKALEAPTSNFGGKLSQALYDARAVALDEMIASHPDGRSGASGRRRSRRAGRERNHRRRSRRYRREIAAWYQANQARVQGAIARAGAAADSHFLTRSGCRRSRQYIDDLKSKTRCGSMLDPPRQKVAMAANSPARGPRTRRSRSSSSPTSSAVLLRVGPSLKQVFDTYGDRIHLVYREYPLPNHPHARVASEAGLCANEQGKFWAFHDRLFANQQKLSPAELKQHAAELGLDAAKFNACVDSHKYAAQVEADIEAANDAGVNGTPAFFINGRALSGAQPFEEFKRGHRRRARREEALSSLQAQSRISLQAQS
jgi:hypothetical protein